MTTTKAKGKRIPLAHPGEHLAEFLEDAAMTAEECAEAMGVPARLIHGILFGERITPDVGVRLARLFGQSHDFWIRLQAKHDAEHAASFTS